LRGPIGVGVRQEDRELVTADPEGAVGSPDLLQQEAPTSARSSSPTA
jgi:hypothetical protein